MRLRDLGTKRLAWRDLYVICYTNMGDPTSLLAQALNPEFGQWGSMTDQLLAETVDTLHAISWQLGGGKGPRPDPIERPGRKKKNLLLDPNASSGFKGLDRQTIVDPRDWLGEDPAWADFFNKGPK